MAAAAAADCSKLVISSWKAVASSLQASLRGNGNSGRQDQSFADAQKDYQHSIRVLEEQIKSLQKYTGLIADYPNVMIDFPDAKNAEDSAECFNENFDKIQKIVGHMDDEILAAKAARDEMKKLSGKSDEARNNLADTLGGIALASATSDNEKPEGADRRQSDVTGIDEKEELTDGEDKPSTLSVATAADEPALPAGVKLSTFVTEEGEETIRLTDANGNPFANEAVEGSLTASAARTAAAAAAGGSAKRAKVQSGGRDAVSFMLKGSAHANVFQMKDGFSESSYVDGAGRSLASPDPAIGQAEGSTLFEIISGRYKKTELFKDAH